ncbi:MAG: hypothetical protein ACP5ID_06615 [Conexivisphaera sp.]
MYRHDAILAASSFSALSVGISLLATGLHERSSFLASTAELRLEALDLEEVLDRGVIMPMNPESIPAYRVSAILRNGGAATVGNAKAVVELLDADDLRAAMSSSRCDGGRQLLDASVGKVVAGELLPWAIKETQFQDLCHIVSISPDQAMRLLLLEFELDEAGWASVRIYSEYCPDRKTYRACLSLGPGRALRLKVTVSGENLRRPSMFQLSVTAAALGEIVDSYRRGALRPEDLRNELRLST